MWATFRLNSAMDSPPSITHSRPWTPPDTDSEYFADPFGIDSITPDDPTESWPDHELISPRTSSNRPRRVSSATSPSYSVKALIDSEARAHNEKQEYTPEVAAHEPSSVKSSPERVHLEVQPLPSAPTINSPLKGKKPQNKHVERTQDWAADSSIDPHTPVKPIRTPEPRAHDGIPQYPYTPDSARTSRTYEIPAPLRPLSPSPWEARKDSTPMQSALSSCISHLENLIEMEYLVTKFEEMAQFLSAPEAQSRQSDDHLFSEVEMPSYAELGITGEGVGDQERAKEAVLAASYVQEVGRYVDGVRKHAEDLKMRMDEVKLLNSIQLDIIADLRRELRKPRVLEEKSVPKRFEAKSQEWKNIPPQGIGFWASVGAALDSVGDLLFEW
jgi:hypothetical protein